MKRVLLALAALAAVTTAAAQPDQYGWRHDPQRLDPEVRQALRHYCQIMRARHQRDRAVVVPSVCRRYFPGMFFPQRRTP